jgi:hypothetical protein
LNGYSTPVTTIALTRHETEARLTAVAPAIRALGVVRLALFGSVLRNQAQPDSDAHPLVRHQGHADEGAREARTSGPGPAGETSSELGPVKK